MSIMVTKILRRQDGIIGFDELIILTIDFWMKLIEQGMPNWSWSDRLETLARSLSCTTAIRNNGCRPLLRKSF